MYRCVRCTDASRVNMLLVFRYSRRTDPPTIQLYSLHQVYICIRSTVYTGYTNASDVQMHQTNRCLKCTDASGTQMYKAHRCIRYTDASDIQMHLKCTDASDVQMLQVYRFFRCTDASGVQIAQGVCTDASCVHIFQVHSLHQVYR